MYKPKHPLLIGILIGVFGCAKGLKKLPPPLPEVNTQTDPDNCGQRGNVCIARSIDACREGYCQCGSNYDCHWPDECREGLCHAANSAGDKCWDDVNCAENEYCIGGHCGPRAITTEICDGFDNDGNGMTDEPEDTMRACYTGPPKTLGVGACHAGMHLCVMGQYTECLNQWVPHRETGRFACDNEDSDCDGCVDGYGNATLGCQKAVPPIIDIVVIMDYSGSMEGYIEACIEAAHSFLAQFDGDDRFRFSLVSTTEDYSSGYVEVFEPLTDFKTFVTALETMMSLGSGIEPTYDAVYRIADGEFDAEIGFRPDSLPVYLVFGDEEAQSVRTPLLTEVDVCAKVDSRGVLLSIITRPYIFSYWDLCAAKYSFPISMVPVEMNVSLKGILKLPCFNN